MDDPNRPANSDTANSSESSAGSSAEGNGGGSQLTIEELQSQLAALEERRSGLQSLADKRHAELEKLKRGNMDELKALQEQMSQLQSLVSGLKQAPSVEDIVGQLAKTLAAQQAVQGFRSELATRYQGIDLDKVTGQTPEEMEQQAKALKEELDKQTAAIRESVEADVRAKYEAQYGKLRDGNNDAVDQGHRGDADGGTLTVERFLEMSQEEEDALSDEDWNRMMSLASAQFGLGNTLVGSETPTASTDSGDEQAGG